MKKKLLLLAALSFGIFGFAQDGIIAPSAPSIATVGETITVGYTYDATATGTCEIAMYQSTADGKNIDWSKPTGLYYKDANLPAGTGKELSTSFVIPSKVAPTTTLPSGVVYLWFFKLSVAGKDYYGNNLSTTIQAGIANEITLPKAPTTAAVGGTITAGFTYNASAEGTAEAQMYQSTADGKNIDWSKPTALYYKGLNLPAGTGQEFSTSFVIPSSVAPSSTLPSGVVYLWFFKLSVGGKDYYPGSFATTTVTAGIANGILVPDAPKSAAVGEAIKAGFTYNASEAGTIEMQMYQSTVGGKNIDWTKPTALYYTSTVPAGAGLSILNDFVIPETVAVSSTLPAGVTYVWFFKLSVAGKDFYGANLATVITPSLKNTDFEKVSAKEMFVNSKSKQLSINSLNVKSESANIYDMTGKVVYSISKLRDSQLVDLAPLNKGIYILVTNDMRSLKFGF
jgi:hypothetical protein